ncbi:hypothetical protein ABEB36_015091 [Hypothenemus hampei]|uniref:BED-type domain-containing protein n=1 Tax=Hypothenemus hampei TaxID=57062 RepID=A0ABD1E0D7_HYPHA
MYSIDYITVIKVKQSFVWRYFIKSSNGGGATCKICNREVKSGGKGGGTTNLINHLKRNHRNIKEIEIPLVEDGKQNTTQLEKRISNCVGVSFASMSSTEIAKDNEYIETGSSLSTFSSVVSEEENSSFSTMNCSQPRIDTTFKDLRSFKDGGTKAGEIMNAILFMIAKDNLPYQTVEKEGFKFLMKTIIPLYKVPGRKSITQRMEEKYSFLSSCIKQKMETIEYTSRFQEPIFE